MLEQYKEQLTKCKVVNKQLLIEKTKAEKKEARKKAMEGRLRLGQFARQGHGYHETWMNGWAFTDIERYTLQYATAASSVIYLGSYNMYIYDPSSTSRDHILYRDS